MRPPLFRVGVLLLAGVAVALWVAFNEYAEHVEYPLNVWRMDLDDAAIGLGTILLGIAAIWTVWLKAEDAHDRTIALSHKLNGGLAIAAREHMQDNEVIVGLVHRLDRMEMQRDECNDRYDDLREQIKELGKQ